MEETHKVNSRAFYTIDTLSDAWKRLGSSNAFTFRRLRAYSDTVRTIDMAYTKCPGEQIILLETVDYDPYIYLRKTSSDLHGWNKAPRFEEIVLDYFNDYYSLVERNVHNEILSQRVIQVGGNEAVELVYSSEQEFVNFCTSGRAKMQPVRTKWIVIRYGDTVKPAHPAKVGFLSPSKVPHQKMVVLWYRSPQRNFEEAGNEFDRMVESFAFLDEKK